jgi:hypothetical protein
MRRQLRLDCLNSKKPPLGDSYYITLEANEVDTLAPALKHEDKPKPKEWGQVEAAVHE